MFSTEDTIVAIASAAGSAQRGIIRLSGPAVPRALRRVIANIESTVASASSATAYRVATRNLEGFPSVPADLYYWPDERSYTQQCSAELHLPGAAPLLQFILNTICLDKQPSTTVAEQDQCIRVAQPGEFTLRAFLAGRIDLTQAEAVLGVIDARDKKELELALSQLAGGLNSRFEILRQQLLTMLAHLEAGLDFAEEDIEFIARDKIKKQVGHVHQELLGIALQLEQRLISGMEYRIVLRGEANAGKSTLFNALAQQPLAIVSDIAGTTRDYVSQSLQLNGMPCLLIDTAGVESVDASLSVIEQHAQEMTCEQQKYAHLEILCLDGSRQRSQWETQQLQTTPPHARIVVQTKGDCANFDSTAAADVTTSVNLQHDEGLQALEKLIGVRLQRQAGEAIILQQTASRCQESLLQATLSIERALELCNTDQGEELLAAELRHVLQHLGLIVGTVYNDDILEEIFSTFCIGK
ncbi:MAG: GTP-binding protein [Planctomycetaceae bacterium]|jgi:tRNA modification GTPase|nr:GTP-binding protein [Planctomycetaceae bacterium]MBT4011339.1 GTP-binding protein [Planctomycetaceae bacterium]MBT4725711.1 GTP-binding protein [Planctomycetaceae bacterium]MBT4845351.1 GTP-binding protein [Planctomycetaceae bacterium]MBT5124598.1 GTP-binding protein [Planctomycetaceae bacterium]